MSILEKLDNTPLWIIFIIALLLMALPLLRPLGLPLRVSQETNDFFAEIKKLNSGDRVLFAIDYEAGTISILEPGVIATWKYAIEKDLKLIVLSMSYQSPPLYERAVSKIRPEDSGWTYGENWVYFGYLPGLETAQAAIAKDIRSLISVDYYGTPIDDIPVMQGVNNVNDFKLLISFNDGNPEGWIRQVQTPYGIPYICHVIDLLVPPMRPYYESKQISGLLKGSGGAAELEFLTGRPGDAVKVSDLLSIVLGYSLALIFLGNVISFMRRAK